MYLLLTILTVSMLASPSETSSNEATPSQEFEKKFNLLMVRIEHLERSETQLKKRIENLEVKLEKKMDKEIVDDEVTDTREDRDKSAKEIEAGIAPRAGNDTEQRLAYLEELSKMNLRRSCHELSQYGVNVNDHYYVDPDGELVGAAPIRVWCDFSEGSAVTEVMHNSEEKIDVQHCHDPGCDIKKIEYSAPDFQIQSLIHISGNCSQSIEYNCLMAPLQKDDVDFAFWLDKSGERQTYWDGANAGSHVCGCYFTEEGCLDEATTHHTCNCDNNVPEMKHDFGSITNASALPVSQLQFGGLTYQMQEASYQLGRLRCWGQASFEHGTSCTAIKKAGEFRSGFFNVKKSQDVNSELVFCKSSPGYDDNEDNEVFVESSEDHFQAVESTISGIETEISNITDVGDQVSILEDKVFHLMKHSDYCAYQSYWDSANHVVTYDRLYVANNVNMPGSTLNIGTGKFTAATSGLYQVDVSMRMQSTSEIFNYVSLRRNGVNIGESLMYSHVQTSAASWEMGGRSIMVQLEEGDNLDLHAERLYRLYYVTICIKLTK